MIPRSYLYVPGDRLEMLVKAAHRGSDAVIADLEDAVAESGKITAREAVREWIGGLAGTPIVAIWVRVNNRPDLLDADLMMATHPAVAGVVVPKTESAARLAEITASLPDHMAVIPLIESARGVQAAPGIAAAERVQRLSLGEVDLAADLGIDPSPGGAEFAPVRSRIVIASAAAGIEAPVAPVATDFSDLEALASSTRALQRFGFGARAAIHPSQLPIINQVFTPTAAEVERAQRLVDAARRSGDLGAGAFVGEDGTMVDEAVVRRARRLLERAVAHGVGPRVPPPEGPA